MSAPLSQLKVDATLEDLLNLHARQVKMDLNCHAVATIQSFDPVELTVVATVNYGSVFSILNPDGTITEKIVPYPLLTDTPLVILGGGQCALTFPIQKGDQCVILFNDRDIDNWWVDGARDGSLNSNRLHAFSDGLALVGFMPVDNYDPSRALLTDGHVAVGINPSTHKATVKNDTQNLNTILQGIITQLETLANTVSVPGNPLNPAVATALAGYATQLGALLE